MHSFAEVLVCAVELVRARGYTGGNNVVRKCEMLLLAHSVHATVFLLIDLFYVFT